MKEIFKKRKTAMTSVIGKLRRRGRTVEMIPAKEKRLKMVDFKLDGKLTKFKFAYNEQVNILFELKNDGRVGWFLKSYAELYIMYIDATKTAYIIDVQRARDYIENPMHLVEKTSKGTIGDGESYMIPIQTLLDHNIILEIMA